MSSMLWLYLLSELLLIPEHIYNLIKGNGVDLEEKDVLFVRRGSYRIGSVAMVSKFDKKVLLTREIQVFRILKKDNEYGIDPFYLLYLLSHQLTQKQLYNKIMIDTTLPNIARRWEELYLPIAQNKEEMKKIKEMIREAFIKKWEAQEKIISIKNEFGDLVT